MNEKLEHGSNSFVLLQLGERRFALPAGRIVELVPMRSLFRFPHRSPRIEGVVLRRGRIVPVCDVSEELTGQRLPGRRFYLVTLRRYGAGMESVALPVTGECEMIAAEMTLADGGCPPHVQGWISHDGQVIEVLELDRLIPGPESCTLAADLVAAGDLLP